MPSVYPPEKADTLEDLAAKLGLPATKLQETIATFNAACGEGAFHPTELDGLATNGVSPP